MAMYNPAHPEMLIADQMGGRTLTELAQHRVITGRAGISADMALPLVDVFGVKADIDSGCRQSGIVAGFAEESGEAGAGAYSGLTALRRILRRA